jgi:hypothetical protein
MPPHREGSHVIAYMSIDISNIDMKTIVIVQL